MKKSIFLFFATLLCATSALAGTYYYSGEGNNTSWSKKAMTVSTDGFYEYYKVSSNTTHQFKIGTSSNQFAYNHTYVQKGYNNTNVTNIGDYGANNCYCWHGSTHYILVYKPKTAINTTDKPIICASTTLPDSRNHGFEQDNNGIKFYHGSDTEWKFNGQNAQTKNLNTITQLYLKEWFVQLYENWDGAKGNVKMQYNIHLAKNTPGNYTDIEKNWTDGQGTWSNYYSYPKYGNNSFDINLLEGLGSGKYTMSFKYYDKDLNITSPIHKLNWTIAVPDITSAECTSNGTGLGTEASPFLVLEGDVLTLTVKGTQKSNDANSELYAQFASNAYSSTLTHNITPTTTVQSITIKVKYYNSADKLSSNEKTLTIYYKAFQEETHDVTISYKCNGNKIDNVDDEILKVGVSTSSEITAPAIAGYTFSSWTLGAGVQSANATANPISITTKSSSSDYTLTANYEEDLSSNWHLVGKNSAFPDGWNITETSMMKKLSGHSTEKVVYMTLNVQNLETHEFKVVDDNGSSDDIWYGYSSEEGNFLTWDNSGTKTVYTGNGNQNHLKFEPTIKGEYEFKVDYSGTYPDVTITYPEIPVVAVKLAGTMTGWEDSPAAFTISGKTATLTLTLTQGYYEFKMIETTLVDAKEEDNWYGNGGTMTRKNCTEWTFNSGDNNATIFADADGAYTFEWDITTNKLSVTNMPKFPDLSNQPATLYFRPSTNWKKDNPKYAAYFCYGNIDTEDKWVELTPENGIYKVDNDKKYVMVIFVRLKSAGALSWDDKLAQTDNIIIPNTPNNLNTCLAFWLNYGNDVSVPVSECTWVAPTPLTDKNWSDFVTTYAGKTINVLVERSFNSGQYHTLCLPFDIPTNWLGDGTTAYQLTSIVANNTGDKLSLNATKWETIVAGQPYIIVPVKGREYEHVIINNVTVKNVSAGTNVATGAGYKATLKAVTATDGTKTNGTTEYYVGAEDGKLYNAQTNKLGLRALIELTTIGGQPLPAKVRAYVAAEENEATGFENIVAPEGQAMKVIENGQLIIIRNGEKFNAQGVRL